MDDERDLFLNQALDPTRCFLCGAAVGAGQRSREHVFPEWMQHEFSLWNQKLTLLNHTTIPYRQLVITCCKICNNEILSQLEDEVKSAFIEGADAVRQLDPERLFLWLAKFYYGLLFRDLTLAVERSDPSLGMIMDQDTLREVGLHHLLLRRLKGQVSWNEFPASIFVFEALTSRNNSRNFDYSDSLEQPFLTMRCGSTYLVAFLQDFGAVSKLDVDRWSQLVAARSLKLHPLQCLEGYSGEGVRFAANFRLAARLRERRPVSRKDWVNQTQSHRNRPRMYRTTGFSKDEIIDLCALVYANEEHCDIEPWPRSLGLYKSVVIALTYMRRNRVQ